MKFSGFLAFGVGNITYQTCDSVKPSGKRLGYAADRYGSLRDECLAFGPRRAPNRMKMSKLVPSKPDSAWGKAFSQLRSRVTQEEWGTISRFHSPEGVQDLVDSLAMKYNQKQVPKFLDRCNKIIEALRPFMAAVDVFVQTDNTGIACFIWGSIRVVIEIISRSHRIAESVTETLDKCCLRLPLYKKLLDIFPMAPNLETALVEMYKTLTELSIYIIHYFKSNPIANMARNLVGRFQSQISRLGSRVDAQVAQIEQEERIADLEAQKRRHETLENILKGRPTNLVSATPAKHVPFSRNLYFVGRANELQTLHNALAPEMSQGSTIRQQRIVVLQGLGGMGKTEIALEYAHRSMNCFDSVLWVAAETEQKAENSFSKISVSLNIAQTNSRARDEVVRWLNDTETTWLLIFDNAPDEDVRFLRDFMPNGRRGSILVTTRNARLAREFNIPADIRLDPIEEEDSIKILTSRLPGILDASSRIQAAAICRQLGCLPLALSQIAGYLEESGCGLNDFLPTYRNAENLPELYAACNPGSTTGYTHNLSTVWTMTMSSLQTKSTTAIRTLGVLAFLDPDGFPQDVIENVCPLLGLNHGYRYMSKVFTLRQSIVPLQNHNLITVDRLNSLIKIHRVLQDSVTTQLTSAQKSEAFDVVIKLLYKVFPTKELAEKQGFDTVCQVGDRFYPHILAALSKYHHVEAQVQGSNELNTLIQRLFWYLHQRGLYATALPFFDVAIEIYNKERAQNLQYLAFLQGTAGTIYRNSDEAERAIAYFKEEIKICNEAKEVGQIYDDEERPMLSYAYEHMANATQQVGKYQEAFSWHSKNLDILERLPTSNKAALLKSYVNKTWALWKVGRLEDASLLLEKVIKESQPMLVKNSQDFQARRVMSYALRVLGNVRHDQGDMDAAFEIHQQAFHYQVQTWGQNHFETGVVCYRIGCYHELSGETDTAIEHFRCAHQILMDNPLPTKSLLVRTKYKLGRVLLSNGQIDEGSKLVEEAKKGRLEMTGTSAAAGDSMAAYDSLVPYWAW